MAPVKGAIHEYSERKIAFEFGESNLPNVLVFVGGLMDGLLTVPYLPLLAEKLAEFGWSLIQIQISSSHIGWGTGSLQRDSEEICELVKYLKSEKGGNRCHVGLMGHSTGCQNTMHYLTHFNNCPEQLVDFGIMQAPVSDRVAGADSLASDLFVESVKYAEDLISNKQQDELMPRKYTKHFFNVPITAYRWFSLMGVRGDDDFFSPDLDANDFALTFGKINVPFLILYSGADEYVPSWVNAAELLNKWESSSNPHYWSSFSKIVEGGLHNLGEGSKENAAENATTTAVDFIKSLP